MTFKDTQAAGSRHALLRIKLLHTAIWAIFVAAIVAIPVAALLDAFRAALWLSALVWLEVLVLLANGLRCPLTGIAARHTQDRAANFDIFLPEPLARHNKLIFGFLFAAGEVFFSGVGWAIRVFAVTLRWRGSAPSPFEARPLGSG